MSSSLRVAALVGLLPFVLAVNITTPNPGTTYGTWDGWGTSLAWWANAFGGGSSATTLANLFFTTETVTFDGVSLPGLGLNIVRYNAGACSFNADPDGDTMVESPDIPSIKQMAAFWTNWDSTDPTTSDWTWTVDANQRNMLSLAVQRGAIAELFSNSPVWWMLYNLNPSGSNDGSSDNLESWNYDQHAIYLANIAQKAKESWGVTFTSVEAFNEPSATYWVGTDGTQEGCHFDVSTMSSVIGYLSTELSSRGLTSTIISASDEETYDIATTTLSQYTSAALSKIGRINVHGYEYGGGRRDTLYSAVKAAGKKLWNSEYGEDDATGLSLASNLMLDLYWLHNTAWVYWQVLDVEGWGLITADINSATTSGVAQKYFVLAQFTRHIRPGMTILSSSQANTAVAYDASSKLLVIVAINNAASSQVLEFSLSEFATPGTSGALVSRWETQMVSGGIQYEEFSDTFLSGSTFSATFPANTIMTFEVSNVVL
ncbi:Glyco-hydr-30-2 domain-containing protein [Mycena chlorophos]|uniref:Glyco-hydr-30-2 domain-containing protein n=1 Tax=Mycena chlorophos TaxID=658473 RepID=A0A8H6SSY1_MYCCL|nr:Glyco-hydr-30-2 domain-containing protein [Mycena chlorophos]